METLTFTFSCQTLQRLIEPPDVSVLNGSGGAAGPDGLEGSSDFQEWKRGFLSDKVSREGQTMVDAAPVTELVLMSPRYGLLHQALR